MRTDDEEYADGPSAAAVLAVADGLRRRDPQLAAALAEHAARLSQGDGPRGEAELAAVLARRELDRPDEVVGRGMPSLLAAEDEGRERDAAVLRCALVDAALALGDVAVAEALLEPVVTADGLPEHVRLVVAVARADLAASLGDVRAADAVAAEVQGLAAGREEQLLARADLDLARARARRAARDHTGARDILRVVVDEPVPEAVDGGRRRLLAVAELVETELDLDEPTAACSIAEPLLDRLGDVTTALPLARLRCQLAARAHLPAGELVQAAALARAAVDGLTGRGHDRCLAAAEEILADVAEARDELDAALAARRRAHHLERDALLTQGAVRVALAAGLRSSVAATGVPAGPAARVHEAAEVPVASRATAGRARAGASVASGSAPRRGHDADAPAAGVSSGRLPDRADGVSGRRRARPGPEDPVGVDGDGPARTVDACSVLRGPTPHGLSRILEEITADARSGSAAGSDAGTDTPADGERNGSLRSLRDLEALGSTGLGHATNGHGANEHGQNGHGPSAAGAAEDAVTPERADGGVDGDEEYARELRLTLVDLLAEYGDDELPRADAPTRGATELAPAGRAAPLTAWSFHESSTPARSSAGEGTRDGARTGDVPTDAGPDSGARLADLLAEAMDAFRRAAPGNGTIGPAPAPDHPTALRTDHRTDHRTDRWGVRR